MELFGIYMIKHIVQLKDSTHLSWKTTTHFVKLIQGNAASYDFNSYQYSWHIPFRYVRKDIGTYIISPHIPIVPVFCHLDLIEKFIKNMIESNACYIDWSNESNFTIYEDKIIVVDIDRHNHWPGPLLIKGDIFYDEIIKLLQEIIDDGFVNYLLFHEKQAKIVRDSLLHNQNF